ncbi:hypothetical protein [Streptomyces sp. NBC_01236]|nr:hypothetical protein OG324_49970 [Streptomyces sp. NBC_01236]
MRDRRLHDHLPSRIGCGIGARTAPPTGGADGDAVREMNENYLGTSLAA